MKALTIRQPWAHLIIHGDKRIENRSKRTAYRGPLWIHAGLRYDHADLYAKVHGRVLDESKMTFGAIIGMVIVVDCVKYAQTRDKRWAVGPWCWILENPRALRTPIRCRGHLSFFEHPEISDLSEFGAVAPIVA